VRESTNNPSLLAVTVSDVPVSQVAREQLKEELGEKAIHQALV